MIYLTRRERFCAAHRMFREEWTDEENARFSESAPILTGTAIIIFLGNCKGGTSE